MTAEYAPLSLTQWGVIFGIMTTIGSVVFAAGIWVSDQAVDSKYATDADLILVQQTVKIQLGSLEDAVEDAIAQQKTTTSSVDGLTLVVLDIQARQLTSEVIDLERQKQTDPESWTPGQERNLRDNIRSLEQLKQQRALLVERVNTPTN